MKTQTLHVRKLLMLATLTVLVYSIPQAQTNIFPSNGAAGIGTTAPNASSLLEIKSTTKGFLAPRMKLTQRNAIASPATGLLIYQTDNTPGFYYYNGSAWTAITPAGGNSNGWLLTGNSGTDSSKNFVGTKDKHPLVFRVNNTKAGRIDYSPTILNTSFGFKALLVNTTGTANTSVGYTSLSANTIGSDNAAFGVDALYSNTTGNLNTALGTFALTYNTTGNGNVGVGLNALVYNNGSNNTATGANALYYNASGNNNTANGYEALFSTTGASNTTATGAFALYSNTTGDGNTATGSSALYSNTTGNYNTATGLSALYKNNNGSNNTATGWSALSANTSGSNNTATGMFSLTSNVNGNLNTATGYNALGNSVSGSNNTASGYAALVANTASNNTAIGESALASNTSGDGNTAVGTEAATAGSGSGFQNSAFGYQSLYNNSSSYNVGFGTQTLYNNISGAYNVAIGCFAGYNRDGLIRCTFAGYGADASFNSLSNATAIGYNAVVNASNKIRLGDGSISVVESAAGSWTTSDGRFKNNIKENVKGLEFINLLKPVTYNFDTKKFQEFLLQNYPDSIKKERIAAISPDAMTKSSSVLQTGFVAQDVAAAAKKIGYDFNGVHAPENATDNWSLSYEKIVVPLVKAVQELSKMNDDKDAKIDNLQKQIDDLKAIVTSGAVNNSSAVTLTGASLEQNKPNPFAHTTTINYILPQKFTSAQIVITDKNGKTLKQINVSDNGKGSVNIDAATLASGAYNYSLLVDGKLIGTKQMILSK